jgi:hypothetical protein
MKISKKIFTATALSVGVTLLVVAAPAHAATGSNSSPLSGITDWFNEAKSSVEKYTKTISQKMAGLGKQFEKIAQDATGELGLVDPAKARTSMEKR